MWLARILSVFSCRMSSRILWFCLCSSNRTYSQNVKTHPSTSVAQRAARPQGLD